MTENERITKLDIVYTATNIKNELDSFTISQAFNKLQRYECLGTVEEFKVLKEKEERFERNIKMFYEIGLKIRAKVIDEFAEKLSLEISESIIWDMLVTMSKNSSLSDTSDKIVDYVSETSKKIAEQMKAGGIIG